MFEVGDMVVCVDAKNRPGYGWLRGDAPVEGWIYTVRGFKPARDEPGLLLVELVRPSGLSYRASRFRKIRKPSIEIFREIVASVKGGVHAK